MKQTLRITFVLIAAVIGMNAAADDSKVDHASLVAAFVAAFNAHDPVAMGRLVTEDIVWLSIDQDSLSIEVEGRAALLDSMKSYFESCPSCQSTLEGQLSTGERLSTIEVARWTSAQGPRSQRSLAVYEFSSSLIERVYYFPAEVTSQATPAAGPAPDTR